eukprot:sb/3468086/
MCPSSQPQTTKHPRKTRSQSQKTSPKCSKVLSPSQQNSRTMTKDSRTLPQPSPSPKQRNSRTMIPPYSYKKAKVKSEVTSPTQQQQQKSQKLLDQSSNVQSNTQQSLQLSNQSQFQSQSQFHSQTQISQSQKSVQTQQSQSQFQSQKPQTQTSQSENSQSQTQQEDTATYQVATLQPSAAIPTESRCITPPITQQSIAVIPGGVITEMVTGADGSRLVKGPNLIEVVKAHNLIAKEAVKGPIPMLTCTPEIPTVRMSNASYKPTSQQVIQIVN